MRAHGYRVNVQAVTLLLACLAAVVPAGASVARRLTLEDLADHATNIVVGHCAGVESRWNDDHTQIVTVARYDVADDLKGELRGSVEVESLGGEVGDIGMYVPGMPAFVSGADEVLFLSPGKGTFEVVGMAQGQFRISFPAASTSPIVRRPLSGLELLGADDARLSDGSLSSFIRVIRNVVSR